MARLIVTGRSGNTREIVGQNGRSVMENLRDAGCAELLALCGVNCSCATCHVYVDQRDIERLPIMKDDEGNLLESSEHRTANSRLSCQVLFDEELDGLRLTIAPED